MTDHTDRDGSLRQLPDSYRELTAVAAGSGTSCLTHRPPCRPGEAPPSAPRTARPQTEGDNRALPYVPS
ncbi:hypothetical protein, partial [Streptomyces scabichelini]|uniref:hypothetical protein n=1 Tax=Streptomyces scabichelini TaxID=2711217 RepID=UPI0019D29916